MKDLTFIYKVYMLGKPYKKYNIGINLSYAYFLWEKPYHFPV